MGYGCPKCNMENGSFALLQESADGVLVCPRNPSHRYKADDSGFIRPVKRQE